MKSNKITTKDITFISFMTAITIVFSIILRFIPFSFILIIIIIPCIASFVSIKINLWKSLIYFFASILLSSLFSINDIGNILFYMIPGLFSGILLGFLIKKKLYLFEILPLISFISYLIFLILIPLINLIYGINFINVFLSLFKLENTNLNLTIIYLILFISNVITTLFSLLFNYYLCMKFQLKINLITTKKLQNPCSSLIFLIFAILLNFCPFLNIYILYETFIIGLYFSLIQLFYLNFTKKYNIVFVVLVFIILIILSYYSALIIPLKFLSILLIIPFILNDIYLISFNKIIY